MSKFIIIKYVITYLLCLHCPLSDKFFTSFLFSSLFRPCLCVYICVCVHILYLNFNPFLMARMAGCAIILFYPFYAVCPLRQQQQQHQSQPSLSLLLALLMPCRQQFLWYICFIAWLFCRVCHVSPSNYLLPRTHMYRVVCVCRL